MTGVWEPVPCGGMQINRLNCDGTLATGPEDVVLLCGEQVRSFGWTPTGGVPAATISGACSKYVSPAERPDGCDITVGQCNQLDSALFSTMGLYEPVREDPGGGNPLVVVGFEPRVASSSVGLCCDGSTCDWPGVAVIIWARGIGCDEDADATRPYNVFVIPKWQPVHDQILADKDNPLQGSHTWTGAGQRNTAYGQGPGNIYPQAAGLGKKFATFMTATAPPVCGDVACGCSSQDGWQNAVGGAPLIPA